MVREEKAHSEALEGWPWGECRVRVAPPPSGNRQRSPYDNPKCPIREIGLLPPKPDRLLPSPTPPPPPEALAVCHFLPKGSALSLPHLGCWHLYLPVGSSYPSLSLTPPSNPSANAFAFTFKTRPESGHVPPPPLRRRLPPALPQQCPKGPFASALALYSMLSTLPNRAFWRMQVTPYHLSAHHPAKTPCLSVKKPKSSQ